VTISDQIAKMWSDFLAWLSTIVIPDWSAVIGLLPLLLLIGVIGPLLTLAVLAWLGYGVTKPRTKVEYVEGTRTAPLDHLGAPIFPPGEPYCPHDGLIYPYGVTRCDRDKTLLQVRCPKCGLVRDSDIQTCGNCGLVLKIEPRTLIVATDRPPPGGAAVA
jgi:ribosomal protein S27AE